MLTDFDSPLEEAWTQGSDLGWFFGGGSGSDGGGGDGWLGDFFVFGFFFFAAFPDFGDLLVRQVGVKTHMKSLCIL